MSESKWGKLKRAGGMRGALERARFWFLAFSFPEPTKTKKQKQKESDS